MGEGRYKTQDIFLLSARVKYIHIVQYYVLMNKRENIDLVEIYYYLHFLPIQREELHQNGGKHKEEDGAFGIFSAMMVKELYVPGGGSLQIWATNIDFVAG
ncbi:hypothetical protein KIL84_006862 [Mauremys mutica]|uniref:Uncharacterized protein n=1 Tax=Mauremys mutica TaxID=74926 RepID=A0A9D3X008_9SAUR|nr:hypothetical protein KIL84_006862 [Mauremys mutica]